MVFYTKIAGVTFSNEGENTQNRQRIIADLWREGHLDEGTELTLRRDPHNPYDPNAVAVLAPDARQLGFLPAAVAMDIAPRMDQGEIYCAFVASVTGGDADSWYGVNIKIVYGNERQDRDNLDEKRNADFLEKFPFEYDDGVQHKCSKSNGVNLNATKKTDSTKVSELYVMPDKEQPVTHKQTRSSASRGKNVTTSSSKGKKVKSKDKEIIVICPHCRSMVSNFWGYCPKCETKLDKPMQLPVHHIPLGTTSDDTDEDFAKSTELSPGSRSTREVSHTLSDEYNSDDFEGDCYESDLDSIYDE